MIVQISFWANSSVFGVGDTLCNNRWTRSGLLFYSPDSFIFSASGK